MYLAINLSLSVVYIQFLNINGNMFTTNRLVYYRVDNFLFDREEVTAWAAGWAQDCHVCAALPAGTTMLPP
jgi:hypothetical protein